MHKINTHLDVGFRCFNCRTFHSMTDIQLELGRCPCCGETEYLRQSGTTYVYSRDKEYYNQRTGYFYTIREPYYPTPEELNRLRYGRCFGC